MTSDDEFPYLGKSVAGLLREERKRMQRLVEPKLGGMSVNDRGNEVTWWTFAGGRINATIRHALEVLFDYLLDRTGAAEIFLRRRE